MTFFPLVSVVIPAYNSEQYITETVDSVLLQSYRPIEIIVIDDGSTDNTQEKLKPYLHKIKYIKKENGGASSARNKGIINSHGDYIAFLDADDLWRKEKIEKQMALFEDDPNVGLVYCDSSTFDENGTIHLSLKEIVETPTGNVMMDMIVHNFLNNSSVVVRKRCFDQIGLWNENLVNGNDYDMWLRVAVQAKFGFVDYVLVDTRYHSHGLSNLTDLQCENSIKIQEAFICRVKNDIELPKKIVQKTYSYKYLVWGQRLFYQNKYTEARKKLLRAVIYNPSNIQAMLYCIKSIAPHSFICLWRNLVGSKSHSHH